MCSHAYGYSSFTADLTGRCISGINTVKVIADNTLVPNCRWYTGSGIYRTVELLKKPKVHLENVKITTVGIEPAVVCIDCSIPSAKVIVLDASGVPVASGGVGELEIPNAVLWSAENPYLYTFRIETETDSLQMKYGIRKLESLTEYPLSLNRISSVYPLLIHVYFP